MGNLRRRLLVGGRAHHRGKTGRAAVDKFHPPLPQDDVIGGAQPDVAVRHLLPGKIKIGLLQIADRLLHFFVKERGHPCVQGRRKIGEVVRFLHQRRQQRPAPPEHRLAAAQILHRDAQHRVDDGQVIGCVGKSNLPAGSVPGEGLGIFFLHPVGNLVSAPDGRGCDDFRHGAPPCLGLVLPYAGFLRRSLPYPSPYQ